MQFKIPLYWFFGLLPILYVPPALSQTTNADSSALTLGMKDVKAFYHHSTGGFSHLYNGIEYVPYPFKLDKGHLYFLKNEWSRGSVRYDGTDYYDVSMMYDLHKGQLVIVHLINNLRVQLIKEKVERFSLFGHNFKKLNRNPADPNSLETDFYDFLYEGAKISVLVQRQKLLVEKASTSGLSRNIEDKNSYYLLKNGRYFSFGSQKSFLKSLGDHQRELKAYIRENRIKYRKDREGSIMRIAKFYDQQDH